LILSVRVRYAQHEHDGGDTESASTISSGTGLFGGRHIGCAVYRKEDAFVCLIQHQLPEIQQRLLPHWRKPPKRVIRMPTREKETGALTCAVYSIATRSVAYDRAVIEAVNELRDA
jgi:hypothetical protein